MVKWAGVTSQVSCQIPVDLVERLHLMFEQESERFVSDGDKMHNAGQNKGECRENV